MASKRNMDTESSHYWSQAHGRAIRERNEGLRIMDFMGNGWCASNPTETKRQLQKLQTLLVWSWNTRVVNGLWKSYVISLASLPPLFPRDYNSRF